VIKAWLHQVKTVIGFTRGDGNKPAEELSESSDMEAPDDTSLLDELPGVLDSLNESIRQFNDVAQDQKRGIIQQSSALHQVATTSKEFVITSKTIFESTGSVENAATQSLSCCQKGEETLENVKKDMGALTEQVKSLVEDIHELGTHNQQIAGIVEIISEITDQLNLLALNAQIEAVGVGVAGKRFGVVAQEVKHLADTSKKATTRIQKTIRKIIEHIDKLVQDAQKSLEATSRSLEHMNEVANDIRLIHEQVDRTHILSQEIKVSTHQQSSAQEQLSEAIDEVDSLTIQNAETITEQVGKAITQLSDMAQYLSLILEETVLKKPTDAEPLYTEDLH